MCGPALALEMCTEGKPIAAARAEEAGIVDAVIDGDLLEGAIAFAKARAAAREHRRTRDLQDRIGDRAAGITACQAAREMLGKTARGARAPFAAVDAIEACLTMDFDTGSRREIELFADCVLSVESKAMRHLFFAEREVSKIPDVPKDTPARAIARAAVVGAGTMGGGIAMTYANAGIPVSAQGRGSGRARPRHVRHSRELRIDGGEGTDDAGGDGPHARAHYADDELRRLR